MFAYVQTKAMVTFVKINFFKMLSEVKASEQVLNNNSRIYKILIFNAFI